MCQGLSCHHRLVRPTRADAPVLPGERDPAPPMPTLPGPPGGPAPRFSSASTLSVSDRPEASPSRPMAGDEPEPKQVVLGARGEGRFWPDNDPVLSPAAKAAWGEIARLVRWRS